MSICPHIDVYREVTEHARNPCLSPEGNAHIYACMFECVAMCHTIVHGEKHGKHGEERKHMEKTRGSETDRLIK